jgi:hypothetical protein
MATLGADARCFQTCGARADDQHFALGRRWRKLDLWLTAVGTEIADLFVIALALAILCAPIGF